jgi:xanthine/CO dehydrogenase XdhC/CoxF family maturation factor
VLIEPLADARADAFFDALAGCFETRRSAVAATLFALDGEVVPPRRALWCNSETCFDDLGDAGLRDAVVQAITSDHTPRVATLRLPVASGTADVLIERIEPPHALFAIGSNATARALLSAGHALGWRTTLVDSDPARLHEANLPPGARTVHATPQTLRDVLTFDRCSSVVVMTHNLAQDLAWLGALRDAPVAYLGAIGSRERASHMTQDLLPAIAGLHAPAGLDIGSETPAEIALAIAAEITAVLNGRSGGSLRDGDGALHP